MFIKNRITKRPKELVKITAFLVVSGGLVTVLFDLFAFLLQIGKDSIAAGNILLGIICIALYFTKNVVSATLDLWFDEVKNKQAELREMVVNSRTASVLTKVRDKVFDVDGKAMSTSKILSSTKEYLERVWELKASFPSEIINLFSTIVMFVGFVMVTKVEVQNTGLFFSVIVCIAIITVIFSYKRLQYRARNMKIFKALNETRAEIRNDLLNIEPQDEKHSNFMINSYIETMQKSFAYSKKDWRDVNRLNLLESVINSLATIFIIGIKVYEVGFYNVNLETVLAIIALQTIYSNIVGKICSSVRRVERVRESLRGIENFTSDVTKIFEVYDAEETAKISDASAFTVPKFEVEYDSGERRYKLCNPNEFTLQVGEKVLLTGPTGSGKSTFMKMLTGKISLGNVFSERFMSVMHYSDTKLGCHDVLTEIVFGEEYDEEKLIHILKGLHLYEEINLKNDNVIEYLRNTKANHYSTGQRQRLLIARMLYNLSDNVKIVAFDEATNALNDSIAEQVIQFIANYCKDKLLIVASHQVDICQSVATKHFEFVEDGGEFFLKQK